MPITNPRQFISLDYNDADLYGALSQRPSPGTPLQKPTPVTDVNRENASTRVIEQRLWQEESANNAGYFLEQKQQAAAREQEITRREQAQRQEIANRTSNSPTSPEVAQPPPEFRLSQPPASTPERQPPPSTGRLPATMNGTGARASSLLEPTATPAPAMLAERIPSPPGGGGGGGGFFDSLPSSLPQAAGRFAIPGAFAVADFGIRTYSGQPVTQAASGAVAGAVGAFAGGVVGTAIAGPVGGFIGATVGGFVAGQASDYFFHSPPSTGTPPIEPINYPPFLGGQVPRSLYRVGATFDVYLGKDLLFTRTLDGLVAGPISAISLKATDVENTQGVGCQIDAFSSSSVYFPGTFLITVGHPNGAEAKALRNITVVRADGNLDSVAQVYSPSPPPDNSPYHYEGTYTVGSGTPAAGTKKGKNRDVVPGIPAGNTPNSTGPYFPGHGGLAPSSTPNPTQTPSNLGGNLPGTAPTPPPLPFAEPKDAPQPRFAAAPGSTGNGSSVGYATVTPATITPSEGYGPDGNYISGTPHPADWTSNPTTAPNPTTPPASNPQTIRPSPIADGDSPVPKAQISPTPEATNDKTNQLIQQQKKDFDDQIARLITIGGILAGLTPILLPDAIAKSPVVKASTQAAVCELAQPQGCIGKAIDNSAEKINQNNNKNTDSLLDKISAGANAAQLALLELINTKLGALLPGGLSATFTRLWQTMQVDRIINILTLITTFHNGLMLSNNLGQTLFAAIDNISQAVGFKWKNEKGEESGFGSIASEWTANFFKSIFGEENYTELVAEYKKANRIYQATANIFNALQSIGYSILSALEVVGSYVALIGNALRKWGEVGESAYKWFNPQPNFHNKFFTTLEGATNVVSQIDQVASEVVSVEQNVAQIGELKNEIGKSIGEEDGSKQGVQPPEATKVKKSFDASKLASATGLELNDTDFESDESD
ncbi:MAG: hypothetical protein V7K27_01710 [Nostoc sp.]|uniref:hypothetical protein n=1 Tax=Nostoc sp. TaxID=1180 RepID=UPI002FFD2CDC